jgi:hypothetical protein
MRKEISQLYFLKILNSNIKSGLKKKLSFSLSVLIIIGHTGVPELRKSSITCLLLKISTCSFF